MGRTDDTTNFCLVLYSVLISKLAEDLKIALKDNPSDFRNPFLTFPKT